MTPSAFRVVAGLGTGLSLHGASDGGSKRGCTAAAAHHSAILPTMSKFLPFDEAAAVVQSLGLAGKTEWRAWCKEGMRPPSVPADPPKFYKHDGW